MQHAAVISGDFVASQKIPPAQYDQALYQLQQSVNLLQQRFEIHYQLYRGDEFQALLPNPTHGVFSGLILRLTLISLGLDARLSIGIGEISNPRSDIKSATGHAFTLSGHGLEKIGNKRFTIDADFLPSSFQLATRFCDDRLGQLTARQANALLLHLTMENNQHKHIANTMDTSRVNVTKLLNQARYELIDEYIRVFEQLIKE